MPHGRREGIGDGGRGKEGRQAGGTGRGFDDEGGVETIGTTELEILKTKRHDNIKRKRNSKEDEPGLDINNDVATYNTTETTNRRE